MKNQIKCCEMAIQSDFISVVSVLHACIVSAFPEIDGLLIGPYRVDKCLIFEFNKAKIL